MASFSKIKFLRTHVCKIITRKYSNKPNRILTSERCLPHNFEQELENKILYSSILDKQKLYFGYKKTKIYESIERKKKINLRLEQMKIRPFPSTFKLMGLTVDDNTEISQDQHEIKTRTNTSINNDEFSSRKVNIKNWLHDYEFFDEDDEQEHSTKGTPDPSIPPSTIPCSGCGALLHCADSGLPGYIPSEIFRGRTDIELKRIICQRCHFLKTYNISLDVNVTPETYINTISAIKDKFALAILIVDLLDFPCSIWPGIQDILGHKRPIFVVGNKVDLLPKDSKGYLEHVKKCLIESVLEAGLSKMNIKHVCLISATTGFGVEELITQLHKIWNYKGDVYLIGCTNVGKSSLFNALLRSDYCKVQARDLVQRATTCIWPGTTLNMLKFPILRPSDFRVYQRFIRLFSERSKVAAEKQLRKEQLKETGKVEHATLIGHIGQTYKEADDVLDDFKMSKGFNPILTLNEQSKDYVNSKWCYDTPGVVHSDQIHHLLTTEELLMIMPKQMITPRVFRIKPGMSLFLGGLARLDFISSEIDAIRITVYAAPMLPILITKLEHASEIYGKLLGSDVLGVPKGDEERLKRFPSLEANDKIEITGEAYDRATCDITLSSAGWIGLKIPMDRTCSFQPWTPEKRGIHIRKPSLIPLGDRLRGDRVRGTLAYRLGKPFIKL